MPAGIISTPPRILQIPGKFFILPGRMARAVKSSIRITIPVLSWVFIVCFLSGCMTEERKSALFFGNDFDNYRNWGFDNVTLYDGDAYSGKYCCKTDGANNYGIGLTFSYDELIKMNPKYFVVSAYVKSSKIHPSAFIVATFDEDKYSLAWNGIDLNKEIIVANDWTFVTAKYDFPKNIYSGIIFKSFLWNTSGQTILIDNMSVEFFK